MIHVEDLKFSYPNSTEETLKGLTFDINDGEIFGFLGPSGAGKSTTQKIIIGILKKYIGSVKVCNKELKNYKNEYFEQIGVAFEFPNLYTKFTAYENLKFFQSLYKNQKTDIMYLLDIVGLKDDYNLRVSHYSKGMKMRLNFCRALLNDPDILFLDEPTSGLDPVNAQKIKNIILRKKKEGKTIFLTTHNMQDADELCDRVAFINKGKINLIGNPRDLKLERGKKTICIEYTENKTRLTKTFNFEGLVSNKDFYSLLKNKNIETIHSQETNLRDIFIEVTGSELQ